MCWNGEIPEMQAYRQGRLHTHMKPEQSPGNSVQALLLGTAIPNVFLSAAHISEYVDAKRRLQKWKIGRQEKIPLGKDLKLILKNVRWRMRAGI